MLGKAGQVKGYKYTDAKQVYGPCKTVLMQRGKLLKAVCGGKNSATPLEYDLTTGEGSVALSLGVGATLGYCAEFGGAAVQRDDGERKHGTLDDRLQRVGLIAQIEHQRKLAHQRMRVAPR